MITTEDAKKLDRIKELESRLSYTRFGIPVALLGFWIMMVIRWGITGIWELNILWGIIVPIVGTIFMAIEIIDWKKNKEELILLKWELGLK